VDHSGRDAEVLDARQARLQVPQARYQLAQGQAGVSARYLEPEVAEETGGSPGRRTEDALALLQSLQAHEGFEGAFLNGWTEGRDGIDISCTVGYAPKPPGADPLRKTDRLPGASQ
jgi:hypothetical protein